MATRVIADVVLVGGVPKDDVAVAAYAASRFSGEPALNAPAPDADPPDASGTTGPTHGGKGAWRLTVPTEDAYYVRALMGGVAGWELYPEVGRGDSLTQRVTLDLSDADLRALWGAPLEVVAAPGAGKVIDPRWCFFGFTLDDPGTYPPYEVSLALDTEAGVTGSGYSSNDLLRNFDNLPEFMNGTSTAYSCAVGLMELAFKDLADLADRPLWLYPIRADAGTILATELAGGGADYAVADTIGMSGGLSVTVDTVDGGGAVLTYTVTDYGSFAVELGTVLTQASTSGVGTGFTVTVTDINDHATGSLKLVVEYAVMDA